jgi:hypothetical protein
MKAQWDGSPTSLIKGPSMSKRTTLLAVLVLLGAVFLGVQAVLATPPIMWQPELFDMGIAPGGQMQVQITAEFGSNLPPTRVEVTPSLAPFVAAITPSALPALAKGGTVTLNIEFRTASDTPFQTVEGALRLRQAGGKGVGTEAKPLPIILKVGAVSYPPDPGEAGKATLDGIDSNGDGLRDDIERYIAFRYPDQPFVRAALHQYGVAIQNTLRTADDPQASRQVVNQIDRAASCVTYHSDGSGYSKSADLETEMLNTEQRSRAYIKYNVNLGGTVSTLLVGQGAAACDFN